MKTSLALIALSLSGVGCGNNTSDVDNFIQNLATEQCAWEFRCCKDAEIAQMDGHKFTSMDDCVPYHALELQNQLYLDRLAASEGRLRVDGDQASACVNQLDMQACNPKPGAPPIMSNPMMMDACATVLVGATPVGNECIYTHECVTGARCVADADAVGRGVCVPYQEAGDICNDSTDCDPSDPELYCALIDYHCHDRAQLGDKCMVDTTQSPPVVLLECDTTQSGVFCDPTSSTCKKLPTNGQPCLATPLPPGVSSQCDPDPTLMLVCDSSTGGTGTCRAPGQLHDDCTSLACATGLYCDSSSHTCLNLPGLSQPCESSGFQCALPYFCNSEKSPAVCDQPASVGQDCTETPCDTSLYCEETTRVCEPQLATGALCTGEPFNECASEDCAFSAGSSQRTCQPSTVVNTVLCDGR